MLSGFLAGLDKTLKPDERWASGWFVIILVDLESSWVIKYII